MTSAQAPKDAVSGLLAAYASAAPLVLDPMACNGAKRVLLDSLAVAAAAQDHPAALAARAYASRFHGQGACTIWGSGESTNAETAALVNGVLLRCNDYNDLYIGRKNWGHPSDMISALAAVAEAQDASGRDFLVALALGYEILLALFDIVPATNAGWDYSNLTAIAATCAVARLMGLDSLQIEEALSIAVIPHFASDEIESGDLDRRGDLTMWKRFNAGDAMRQAVYACFLASAGAEGAVRPFSGKLGFFTRLGLGEEEIGKLRAGLDVARPLTRISTTTMKRWPVGSRAQSAIQSALDARSRMDATDRIERVEIRTDPAVYKHLVEIRGDAWRPFSRETADHSLPYIVAAAVLDGQIGPSSFDPERVRRPDMSELLQKTSVSPTLHAQGHSEAELAALGYLSEVVIETQAGRRIAGLVAPFPGHASCPLSDAELVSKLGEYVSQHVCDDLVHRVSALEDTNARSLFGRLKFNMEDNGKLRT